MKGWLAAETAACVLGPMADAAELDVIAATAIIKAAGMTPG
jgi:hypothetical protein